MTLALPTDDHGIVRLRRTGAIVQEGQLRRGAFFWTLEMLKINEAEVAAERPLLQPLPLFGRHQHDRLVTGKRDDHQPVRQTPGWATIPIAFSNGDGTWNITNGPAPDFIPSWANQPGVQLAAGKFH